MYSDDDTMLGMTQDHELEHVKAERDRLREVIEALRNLNRAQERYRYAHDTYGDGSHEAGAAWDAMRKSGDKARAALDAAGESNDNR